MSASVSQNKTSNYNSCAVIVAHPDDETLWAGGTILMRPEAKWIIITLCRKDDSDRAPRFHRAVRELFFDLIVTHSVKGEYTRHLRHEETARAVLDLWKTGKIRTNQVWCFAYEDEEGRCLPQPIFDAHLHVELSEEIWRKKKNIITGIYGFSEDSFEAKTTPKQEAFWCFDRPVKQ